MQIIRFLAFSLTIGLLLSGCGDRGVKVHTEFTSASGLEKGEPVYLDNQVVGKVVAIDEGINSTRVDLSIDSEYANLLHTKSAVVVNRSKVDTPVEVFNRSVAEPIPISDGQELQGLDSILELGAWMVGDAIQLGTGTLSDMVESFQGYLQGEQFQSDKQEIKQQLSAAALSAQAAMKNVESDLDSALQELKASETDIALAIEQMGDELSPIVRELSVTGAALIEQLEAFAQNLETEIEQNPNAGQEIFESLSKTFEQLNAEIEGEITIETDQGSQTYTFDREPSDQEQSEQDLSTEAEDQPED